VTTGAPDTQPPPTRVHDTPDLAVFATALLDTGGRVLWWSSGAAGLFVRPASETHGCDIRAAFPRGADQLLLTEALARAADGQVWTGLISVAEAAGPPLICRFEPMLAADREAVLLTATRAPTLPDGVEQRPAQRAALLNATTRIGSTLDLGQTAREMVMVTVPRFADTAAVFVLDRLVEGDEAPGAEADGSIVVRRLAVGYAGADPDDWAGSFPGDEVIVHGPATPYARCVGTAAPVLFDSLDRRTVERLGHDADEQDIARWLRGVAGFLAVPLTARGLVLGYAVFARNLADFGARDVALAQEVAARAAVCIDNARLYRLERRTARALRSALLPPDPDAPPGVEIAHRYLPASGGGQVGGDWYDVIPLAEDRVALVIGDAMGHDTMAASAMVQLRTAAHTLADLELPPDQVLHRLNRMAQKLTDAQLATCLYAVCDPSVGVCELTCAGHVPPLIAHPDGRTERVSLPAGLPLGVGDAAFETRRVQVPSGATLVMCTDGLVERRGRDIDAGIATLRHVLTEPHDDLDTTCDALIDTLDRGCDVDDVTLLLARLTH